MKLRQLSQLSYMLNHRYSVRSVCHANYITWISYPCAFQSNSQQLFCMYHSICHQSELSDRTPYLNLVTLPLNNITEIHESRMSNMTWYISVEQVRMSSFLMTFHDLPWSFIIVHIRFYSKMWQRWDFYQYLWIIYSEKEPNGRFVIIKSNKRLLKPGNWDHRSLYLVVVKHDLLISSTC